MDEIRDLLYFLYDFKYFEEYDVQNESSLFVNRRHTLQTNASSSSESEHFEEEEMNMDF